MKRPVKIKSVEPPTTPLEQWMDCEEVCMKLKISKKTLEAYRAKRILEFSKFQKKCYYKKKDIEDLLEKNYNKQNE